MFNFFSTFCFSVITMGRDGLSLYTSSSGSAAIKNMNGSHSILIFAGGNKPGQATSGGCVVSASLWAVKGGFEGRLIPVSTEFNSYDEDQAQGKKISIEERVGSIIVNDVDFVGICSLDSDLINVYEKINVDDKKYKYVFSEMIDVAHSDALVLFRRGRVVDAIEKLSSFANGYDVAWLADKDLAGVVISAINDYAYFLQKNNEVMASVEYLKKILNAEPGRAVAWLNLADSNWMIGKKDEAIKQYVEYKDIVLAKDERSKIPSRVIKRISKYSGN
ncbi:tetratricopeptide repeat protein [Pseudomonas extremaustralis]|uniref:tetratricopeptide repeat protein n=1 Tax=Pseudomonas extremaustralis TaxID=359110 RepID=UPI002307037D|nr:hypothetical protein [Pseudomonas extremaustralis]MDB1111194.1 hypothetical protein [Pseudomonas extremaustralis]